MLEKIKFTFKKVIGDALYNILLGSIQYIILLFVVFVAYILRDYFVIIIFTRIPIWSIISGIAILYFSLLAYSSFKSKHVHKRDKYGMRWEVNIRKGVATIIKGPLCPSCDCETLDDSPSHCPMCNTDYPKLTMPNGEIARDTVKKVIETEFREGKLLSPNWSISYPHSSFKIINNSASKAKNVSMRLDLKINGETEVVGTYDIGDINPDGIGRIDNSDMMKDAHTVLDAMRFIWINTIVFDSEEIEYVNGYAEHVKDSISTICLLKQFECEFELNISYSLKGMNKPELYNYLLEFKHLVPGEYDNHYENNCSYDFHSIN